jgi:hypothetical protein
MSSPPLAFPCYSARAGAGPGPEERAAIDQLPRPFGAVVQRTTAARLEDRYRTAREMAAASEPKHWKASRRNDATALDVSIFNRRACALQGCVGRIRRVGDRERAKPNTFR